MARLCKQIYGVVKDDVGQLAAVTDKLKASGLNIEAICAWAMEGQGHILMLTDDNDKACEVISPVLDSCQFDEVIRIKAPNTPGGLNEIAQKLAGAGISIDMIYATTDEGDTAAIVVKTTDNAKALEVI